ncbi:MAG: c-type cytochrome [Dokdonella sp.]
MRTLFLLTCALLMAQVAHGASAHSTGAVPDLVDQGRYLATAGDCASCHGTSFAGGDAVPSPIGKIYAANITPDKQTGIGSWSLAQFSDALRNGKAPDGYLYPAMPYPSFTGLTTGQIQALYSYFLLGVPPVSNNPPQTSLPFPFYRPMMGVWNALFLEQGTPTGAIKVSGDVQERGRLLVETLGHCTACHTPRGQLMQQDSKRHLAGAMVAGWWAPNITPGTDGIGGWSNDQLSTFLMTGHTDIAVAAGDMGKAVSHSLSKLSKDDIDAIAAYLRVVPAVASDVPKRTASTQTSVIDVSALEPAGTTDWQTMLGHDTTDGNILYQSACASCHGIDGKGSNDLKHPSLLRLKSITGPDSATLVQVIAHGVNRKVGDTHTLMPSFRSSMSDGQIASVANYVSTKFGGVKGEVSASQVATILKGHVETPWLIRYARWLAILAIALATLIVVALAWTLIRALSHRRGRHV